MAAEKLLIDRIVDRFGEKPFFEIRELAAFYRLKEKTITTATINWRAHYLVRAGVLQRIGRGRYAVGREKQYSPEINTSTKSLYRKLKEEFPYSAFCLWNTSAVNEFMVHQPGRFFTLVETEKETTEAVFYFLKDLKKQVFLNPDVELLERYFSVNKEAFIVKPFVTEMPAQIIKGVVTVTIEKMLVDIFCDEVIFSAHQGAEMKTIFREVFAKYTINRSKMMRYAARRGKKKQLGGFLKTAVNFRQ